MASRGKLMLELALKKSGYAWGEYTSSGTDGDVLMQEVPDDRLIIEKDTSVDIYKDQSFSPNYENYGLSVVDMKDEDGIYDLLENVNSILSGIPANINDYQEANRVMNNNEIDSGKEDSMQLLSKLIKICHLKIILQKVQNVERSPSNLCIRYAHLANARTYVLQNLVK